MIFLSAMAMLLDGPCTLVDRRRGAERGRGTRGCTRWSAGCRRRASSCHKSATVAQALGGHPGELSPCNDRGHSRAIVDRSSIAQSLQRPASGVVDREWCDAAAAGTERHVERRHRGNAEGCRAAPAMAMTNADADG
jgi:hypothetical protein